jgi:hypothetical protein
MDSKRDSFEKFFDYDEAINELPKSSRDLYLDASQKIH